MKKLFYFSYFSYSGMLGLPHFMSGLSQILGEALPGASVMVVPDLQAQYFLQLILMVVTQYKV
jgi:hypothetical protein